MTIRTDFISFRKLITGGKLCSSPNRSPREEVVLQGVDLRLHDHYRQDPKRPGSKDGHVSFDQQYCRGWYFNEIQNILRKK